MNRMLINATHKDEELRIALATGQFLYDLIIESTSREQKQSNIYKGKVTRIEPSLEAAFVDYGEDRHGFLPLKEVARSSFKKSYQDNGRRPTIHEVLDEGQEIIVQVEKEERGNKGAALTTFITLPGCYLVLMPNNPRAGGVSRRIEGDERDELHTALSSLALPEGMGLIIRTAGGGRSIEELQWDLEILLRLWSVIQRAAEGEDSEGRASRRSGPFLIYQEGNAVIRALRDHLRRDIDEIVIDHPDVYEDVVNHLKLIRPDFVSRVKHYKDATPLFTRFQIESQIESAFQRDVRLPSGGSIIIDHTEALVSIDINSAKSTKGVDIEETALKTNLEAADEIARQLRLRDIGGLIVIDFIDMTPLRNQREVEDRLRKALSMDRARVQIGRISRFGLLEMSRQRLRPSLGESSRVTCPRCTGQGTIRGIESLGLSVMRIIEEEALKENTAQVRAILPPEIAAYLLNEKRQAIIDIEKRQNVSIIAVPSAHFLTPQYEIERIRESDMTEKDEKLASYKLALKPEVGSLATTSQSMQKSHQEPAIKNIPMQEIPAAPRHQASSKPSEPGLLKKLFTFLFDKKEEPVEPLRRQSRPRAPLSRTKGPNTRHSNNRNRNRRSADNRGKNPGQTNQYRTQEGRENRAPRDNQDARPARIDANQPTQAPDYEPRDTHPQHVAAPAQTAPQQVRTPQPTQHNHEPRVHTHHEDVRVERVERTERPERPERPERTERAERTERTERAERTEHAPRQQHEPRERSHERAPQHHTHEQQHRAPVERVVAEPRQATPVAAAPQQSAPVTHQQTAYQTPAPAQQAPVERPYVPVAAPQQPVSTPVVQQRPVETEARAQPVHHYTAEPTQHQPQQAAGVTAPGETAAPQGQEAGQQQRRPRSRFNQRRRHRPHTKRPQQGQGGEQRYSQEGEDNYNNGNKKEGSE
ncbi:MAG: Rne/Rng family ribonuclease [Gammaproteobacteria bacterium]